MDINLPTGKLTGLWRFVKSTVPFLGPVAGILVAIELLLQIPDGLDALHTALSAAQTLMVEMDFGTYYGKANRLFPLNEMMVMWGTLMSVRIIAVSIRIIKGWVPTIG